MFTVKTTLLILIYHLQHQGFHFKGSNKSPMSLWTIHSHSEHSFRVSSIVVSVPPHWGHFSSYNSGNRSLCIFSSSIAKSPAFSRKRWQLIRTASFPSSKRICLFSFSLLKKSPLLISFPNPTIEIFDSPMV